MTDSLLLITRHRGAHDWLEEQNIHPDEILKQVTSPEQVEGRTVIGILPLHYAAKTKLYGTIFVPRMPLSMRGQEMTSRQMTQYGARIEWYKILSAESPILEKMQC